jgi:hypothetical protein
MQPRTQQHRTGLIATVPLAVLLAACGATAGTAAQSSLSTPTPIRTATPTQIPSPAPISPPPPGVPLALLYSGSPAPGALQVEAINTKGVQQWGLTQAQEAQYFGLTVAQYGADSSTPQIGGSYLYFFSQATPASVYQVAVVSRTGTLIGHGTAPALNPNPDGTSPFQVSPIKPEWAWTTDETPNASGPHRGVVEVGGLGEANRIVFRWVAPVGFTEQLINWTNSGIIMQRTELGGGFPCGGFESTDYAWFAINPLTDALTDLFAGNDWFEDASSGVTAALPINAPHTVLVNGVTYSESKSVATSAAISPDGVHVAVFRQSFGPCGGTSPSHPLKSSLSPPIVIPT